MSWLNRLAAWNPRCDSRKQRLIGHRIRRAGDSILDSGPYP
jgi:hypothetical protein